MKIKKPVLDDAMLNRIKQRGRDTNFGLNEEEMKLSTNSYSGKTAETMAMVLVGSYFAKYDLISIVQGVIEEIINHYETEIAKHERTIETHNG